MPKELNNPTPGSEEEQLEEGTELEEGKKQKEEVALPEKFKDSKNPLKDVVKAYSELEKKSTKDSTQLGKQGERLAKLEGIAEAQQKVETRLPEITPEQRTAMTKRFKDDFQKDPLVALHNFNAPFMEDVRLTRERAEKLQKELDDVKLKEEGRGMRELAAKARGTGDGAKLFDEMIPDIQEELKKNPAWRGFDNPYEAIFYNLKGKSTKNLARVDDEGRESFVEGSSMVSEEDKSDATLKKKWVDKVVKTKGVAHLR